MQWQWQIVVCSPVMTKSNQASSTRLVVLEACEVVVAGLMSRRKTLTKASQALWKIVGGSLTKQCAVSHKSQGPTKSGMAGMLEGVMLWARKGRRYGFAR
jgi:hypothetical protein